MRVFIHADQVINVDNDQDAERLAADPGTARELPPGEVSEIFGNLAQYAGPENTTVDDGGQILFDRDKADAASIENSKQIQKAQAKVNMDNTLSAGVEVNGRMYACKKIDIDSFSQGLTLLELTQETTIEAYDKNDNPHTLTAGEYRDLCRVVGLTYYSALKAYKAEIKAIEGT